MLESSIMVFSGNANKALSEGIVRKLNMRLGMATVGRFSDGEIYVEIEENVRGRDVFIVQPTCAPTNENLMELLVMIDAMRRASAARITAVMPYYGYARQDRRSRSARVPITARLVADMIGNAGAHRALTVDLHADQIQGFFYMPVDNIYSSRELMEGNRLSNRHDVLTVVSPDVGGVVRRPATTTALRALSPNGASNGS